MSKKSVLIYIFLSLLITFVVTVYFNISNLQNEYKIDIKTHEQIVKNIVNNSKEHTIEFYTRRLNSVISFDVVKEAIKNNDRNLLKKHLLKRYFVLKKENKFVMSLVVIDKNNKVVFRGQNPSMYGDDVSSYRNIIVSVNKTKKITTGQEAGLYGAPFRIAMPISYKGEHIGVIEISLKLFVFMKDINTIFKDKLHSALYINKGMMKYSIEKSESALNALEKDNYLVPTKNKFFIDNINSIDISKTNYVIEYQNKKYHISTSYNLTSFEGKLAAKFVIAYDITEQKKFIRDAIIFQIVKLMFILLAIFYIVKKGFDVYEKRILKQNKDLENSLEELKQTQKHMVESEKMAALGGLVAGVAHEINTPIGLGITGITHFMSSTTKLKKDYENDQMTEEDFKKYIDESSSLAEIIFTNLKRSADLVRDFKEISVDQTNEIKKEFNIKEYLEKIILSVHNKTKQKQVEIRLDCDDTIVINSYPGVYAQIVTNLIINSLIHGFDTKNNGKIDIIVSYKKDTLSIIYKDDGKGIDEDNIKKIFNPFFTTKRDQGGSGLGLNIIYNLITSRLNGSIECKSEVDKWTQFNINIPLKG